MARSIAKIRLDIIHELHRAYGAQRDHLAAQVADLKKRIRLARRLDREGFRHSEMVRVLDLRKPLRPKGKR